MDRQLYLLRNEQQEIEKRKTSVIIRGLPEAKEGKTDLDLCNELLQLLEVNADDPKKASRLGKKPQDGSSSNLRLILANAEDRSTLLSKARSLVRADGTGYSFNPATVFISPGI